MAHALRICGLVAIDHPQHAPRRQPCRVRPTYVNADGNRKECAPWGSSAAQCVTAVCGKLLRSCTHTSNGPSAATCATLLQLDSGMHAKWPLGQIMPCCAEAPGGPTHHLPPRWLSTSRPMWMQLAEPCMVRCLSSVGVQSHTGHFQGTGQASRIDCIRFPSLQLACRHFWQRVACLSCCRAGCNRHQADITSSNAHALTAHTGAFGPTCLQDPPGP